MWSDMAMSLISRVPQHFKENFAKHKLLTDLSNHCGSVGENDCTAPLPWTLLSSHSCPTCEDLQSATECNLCDSVFMFDGFPTGKMLQLDIRNMNAPRTSAL